MEFLENAKIEFLKWREERRHSREKTPEFLLNLASICVSKYGKLKTLRELGMSSFRLNNAVEKYPQKSGLIKKDLEQNSLKKNLVEFKEVILKKNSIIKTNFQNKYEEESEINTLNKELVFEIESNFGFRIKVFSNSEQVHKNILCHFIHGEWKNASNILHK